MQRLIEAASKNEVGYRSWKMVDRQIEFVSKCKMGNVGRQMIHRRVEVTFLESEVSNSGGQMVD